jgi:hypothetical protein
MRVSDGMRTSCVAVSAFVRGGGFGRVLFTATDPTAAAGTSSHMLYRMSNGGQSKSCGSKWKESVDDDGRATTLSSVAADVALVRLRMEPSRDTAVGTALLRRLDDFLAAAGTSVSA